MKSNLKRVIANVIDGKPDPQINLMFKGFTPLILFLYENGVSAETLSVVNRFVDMGASLTLANHLGISPFYFFDLQPR